MGGCSASCRLCLCWSLPASVAHAADEKNTQQLLRRLVVVVTTTAQHCATVEVRVFFRAFELRSIIVRVHTRNARCSSHLSSMTECQHAHTRTHNDVSTTGGSRSRAECAQCRCAWARVKCLINCLHSCNYARRVAHDDLNCFDTAALSMSEAAN